MINKCYMDEIDTDTPHAEKFNCGIKKRDNMMISCQEETFPFSRSKDQ